MANFYILVAGNPFGGSPGLVKSAPSSEFNTPGPAIRRGDEKNNNSEPSEKSNKNTKIARATTFAIDIYRFSKILLKSFQCLLSNACQMIEIRKVRIHNI